MERSMGHRQSRCTEPAVALVATEEDNRLLVVAAVLADNHRTLVEQEAASTEDTDIGGE